MANFLKSDFNPETKVWSGAKMPYIHNKDVSVGRILHSLLPLYPKNVAQINDTEGTTITNGEMFLLTIRTAYSLKELRLTQDDVISIIAPNTTYVAPIMYGAMFEGIPFQALDPSFDKETVAHLWAKTRPKVIFCDGKILNVVKEALSELNLDSPIYTLVNHVDDVNQVDEIFKERGVLAEKFYMPANIKDGNHTLTILCSSGSSGTPKACHLSHRLVIGHYGIGSLHSEDVLLTFSTLYWLTGLWDFMNCGFTGATHLIISRPFTAEEALHLIDKYKVTSTMFPPRNIAMLLNHPDIEKKSLKTLKVINCGGAKLPTELRSRIMKYLNPYCVIFTAYGLTEKGAVAAMFTQDKPESTGKLVPNAEVKIVDLNGNQMGVDEEGEIVMRNFIPWMGYYGNKAATEEIYDLESDWYHTGDIGYFDKDGSLFIVDRLKEIMKVKGYQISPADIEEVLFQLPGISEVSVVGIPDIYSVYLPAALVIKATNSNITEEEIIGHVAAKMPHYKHLTGGVYFVDDFPRTPSGKIKSKAARELGESLYKARN